MRRFHLIFVIGSVLTGLPTIGDTAETHAGAKLVDFYGYSDCIQLENDTTRAILCPQAGGRVLEYSFKGKNALYLDPKAKGWTYQPGKPTASMSAGRFDIGPEKIIPRHPQLWFGKWTAEIIGPRAARLTSAKDKPTGVQLVREFRLDAKSSRLACTQTIKNVSAETKQWCHWSRTFVHGGGICVIPLTAPSRFPNSYVMYENGTLINAKPVDPNIRVRENFLEILAAPKYPKLGMDSYAGWFGYVMPNDLLFVKRFPTYPDRVYNEMAGLTISVWYPDGKKMCELEPIGPRERLAPGKSASFTEEWWLLPYEFPAKGKTIDLQQLTRRVKQTEGR